MKELMPESQLPPPWYKQFWPWLIILLPASVVVAGVATLIIAIKHDDSLVRDDYYREGLAINRRLEQDQRAAALGVEAAIRLQTTLLQLQLSFAEQAFPEHDSPQWPGQLTLGFTHPTDHVRDFSLTLTHIGSGAYTGAATALSSADAQSTHQQKWYLSLTGAQADDSDSRWRLQGLLWTGEQIATATLPGQHQRCQPLIS